MGYTINTSNDRLGVSYIGWKTTNRLMKTDLNFLSTLNPYSSWKFSRLTFDITNTIKKGFFQFSQRAIVGKVFTNDEGVPGQEGFNLEGNASNGLIQKSYLLDQFYGLDVLFKNYHLPGEGNIRGFIWNNELGGEEIIAMTLENSFNTNLDYFDVQIQIANFFDLGFLGNHRNNPRINYSSRFYGDFGFGVRFNKNILGQDYYLRIDSVLLKRKGDESIYGKPDWIFSFQKPI